jgi:hypothetical protein
MTEPMVVYTNAVGNYRFLGAAGQPFSAGVAVDPGYDIVHAVLDGCPPLDRGFEIARQHLSGAGRPPRAVCGMELRTPEPLSPEGFAEFNRGYVARLEEWGVTIDGLVPSARTNVAPIDGSVTEPCVYAYSYTTEAADARGAFLMAGVLEEQGADGTADRVRSIVGVLTARLDQLGLDRESSTVAQFYAAELVQHELEEILLPRLGRAAINGIRWFPSLPPVTPFRIEVDLRRAGFDLLLTK